MLNDLEHTTDYLKKKKSPWKQTAYNIGNTFYESVNGVM